MHFAAKFSVYLFLLITLLYYRGSVHAQCNTAINTFPYNENFETGKGNWFDGGSSSDWAWGTPQKQVINSAASGSKCWIVGGFTKNNYNNGESSWIQSPCFDISALQNPQISFKIFWETERDYDGASFQYSIDGGNNWLTLGSESSNTDCSGYNWFNNTSIIYLGSVQGWSGNIQATSGSCQGGGGSNGWLDASHSLSAIAGKSTVVFRFTFGAGTQCNNFDGFAVDDIHISEAPTSSNDDFNYTCSSNKSISFNTSSSLCQPTFIWNFGDPASNENNISTLENPTHDFSLAGTYKVSLIKSSALFPAITIVKNITVLNINASITKSIKCNGDLSGAATVIASGAVGSYNYSWNTNPVQKNASINNLAAGIYIVTVSAANACSTSSSVTLPEPLATRVDANTTDAVCGNKNGNISITIEGGAAPYKYDWSTGESTSSINNLNSGVYALTVSDANGCKTTADNIEIRNIVNQVTLTLGNDTTICSGDKLLLSPGVFATYKWQDNSTSNSYSVNKTGTYSVTVSDNDGCIGHDEIKITVDCSDVFFPSGFTPDNNGINESFGPLGNVAAIKNYKMIIYSRWGQLIFSSNDPYKKWNGTYKEQAFDTGTYAWFATYMLNGKLQSKKGIITLIH